ncbi:wall-associated receptor kinase 3-like [Carex rostrata]
MKHFQLNTIMKNKKYSPTVSVMAMVMLNIMLIMQLQTAESVQPAIALPGCQDACGDVPIPYPFGISPNCFLGGFELYCNRTYDPPTPSLHGVAVLNISLTLGQARVNNPISSQCYNPNYNNVSYIDYQWNLSGTPFRFNNDKNKFTVIGCDTLAYIQFGNETNLNWGGGVSVCSGLSSIINGSCSGIGCCQTAIPKQTNYYYVEFATTFNNSGVYNFSLCGYAVLMEYDGFMFSSDYITTNKLYNQSMPVVLDWAIGNETCEIAKGNRSYACISDNSVCMNSSNGPGYFCNCSTGYIGNPYLAGGCQDIDECANKNQCSKKCHNLPGTYRCSCPPIMRLKKNTAAGDCELYVPFLIGIGVGILLLVFVGFCFYMAFERRKLSKVKEKYFQQHGGWILLEEIKSNLGFSFTIFSKQQVEQATNNFDSSNIIGQGGQGTVYKGTIKDQLVAIKKCQIIDESKKKEFGKEMLILCQISHKNIVKLLGCCLEVEVPMLVYEFISCGSLFNHIHDQNQRSSVTLETRLRIAHESAEALAYLHYSASPPIFHGDVKSSNILLDENYIAKISDFGASILAPTDESQFVTLVQGTCGYLDPEYLQSCQLTDKSDVYSFGVVLLELLTSKPVIDFDASEEEKCLSSRFLSAMKENTMHDLLDVQMKREDDREIICRVAELAKDCLRVSGEDRPTMKEAADELDRIRKLRNHPWENTNYEETENLLGESSIRMEMENTGNFSIERNVVQNIALGR